MQEVLMTFAQSNIPDAAIEWLGTQIGPYQIMGEYRADSTRTGVWRIQSNLGNFFFKINRRRNRWGTEVFAYRNWAAAFSPFLPKLQAIYDAQDNPGILLAEVNGIPLNTTKLTGHSVDKAYYRAGKLLRDLHGFAVGNWFGSVDEKGQPMDWSGNPLQKELQADLVKQKRNILAGLLQEGMRLGCFSKTEIKVLQWAIDSVGCYDSEVPVPTSEDYTPGNWLVDNDGDLLAIIDFENMLWGDRMLPFARLMNDYFPYFASGEQAFYDGYGSCLPEEHPEQSKIESVIYAGFYVTQGIRSSNENYIRRGRTAFQKIGG
jgi:hypothetical protein